MILLLIRHLVLPGLLDESKKILDWIFDMFGKKAYVSLMSQYYPAYCSYKFPELNRSLTEKEYTEIVEYFCVKDFEDGLMQDLASADKQFTPEFDAMKIKNN